MKITGVKPTRGRGEKVRIELDDGTSLTLSSEVLLRAGIGTGDELSAERLGEIREDDAFWSAREAALNLLSYRARSKAELSRRLAQKGFEESLVERCLEELEAKGLIDDDAFAQSFVRDRVRGKPRGPRRLTQELRQKGVDAQQAEAAIADVLEGEGVSELELARRAARRWRPREGEEPERARRRLYGFLARRGFGSETSRAILDEHGL